ICKVFNAFKQEDVQVWLDDFGTGFASLSLLRKFNIDGLKIDRSFVSGIADNNED
ncbi:MAG TPA: EAL domain-containing protein, partial [Shewanella frigidimarina]|nr:EAL domain-containing protein [Shewanella frigidimarina]